MGDLTNNFSRWEFACKCGCGENNIALELVRRLQVVRDMMGLPIHINSGVRCKEHNENEGGEMDSEHVPTDTRPGEGTDIKCRTSHDRYELLLRLVNRFERIGIGEDFIHVGIRPTKPTEVVWLYE